MNLIKWQCKCLKCKYKFYALTPKKLYNSYELCVQCGSSDIVKSKSTPKTTNTTNKSAKAIS